MLRMVVAERPGLDDGRPVAAVSYVPGQSVLWSRVLDELRELEPGLLLMLTRLDLPIARRLSMPVLLERER